MVIVDVKEVIWYLILATVNAENVFYLRSDVTPVSYVNSKYLINTTGCQIPSIKVEHKDKLTNKSCGTRQVLVQKMSDHIIRFQMFSNCRPFKNGTTIELIHEFLSVQCNNRKKTFEDYYAFVKKVEDVKNDTDKSWNVIVLGMDTMSRARAHNSLKETVAYLKSNQWLDYRGYNKVGLNTSPNLIAILSGKCFEPSLSISSSKSPWSSLNCIPDMYKCNPHIIWHQYKEHGYVTAFGEDLVHMNSIFESHGNRGFRTAPTHYYLRPFFVAGEKLKGPLACSREISSSSQILNYIEDFANTYKDKKFFGFFWINSHSHDAGQSPRDIDTNLATFLERLRNLGVLKNTFVFLLVDHGMRYGSVRYSADGFYEAKLPMFFMSVPWLFRRTRRRQYTNLVTNQKRLVSPYDLHMTLKDILSISDRQFKKTVADGCPKCMSVFNMIPHSRTCSDAAIVEPYCCCHGMKQTSVNEYAAKYSFLKAFEYVRNKSLTVHTLPCTQCLEASLQKLLRIHVYSYIRDRRSKYYVVVFRTSPAGILFQVIVRRFYNNSSFSYEIYSAEALSKFDDMGYCALRSGDRYFCVCKRFLSCILYKGKSIQ